MKTYSLEYIQYITQRFLQVPLLSLFNNKEQFFYSIFNLVYYWLEFIFFQHLNKFTISDSIQDCFMHSRDSKIMPKLYIQPFFLPRYDSLISNFSSQFQYLIHQMSN